jgi:hypothetical protein
MTVNAEDDERIEVITRAANKARQEYADTRFPYPLKNRFDRWGLTASSILLKQFEEMGWTLVKKEKG